MRLDAADREDVEQEIRLALLERHGYFDATRGAWSAFADRVARQAAQGIADGIGSERRVRGPSLDQPIGEDEAGPTLASMLHARLGASDPAQAGVPLAVSLERFVAGLPAELRLVAAAALYEDGDLAEAQRRTGLSTSEFYRRLSEVRSRLFCADLVRRPRQIDR
jgi:DNA-directed RNA polymerase specialized sigma24 family protein